MYNKTEYMRIYTHKNKIRINKQRSVRLNKESPKRREQRLTRMKKWRSENLEYLREYQKVQYQKDITKYSTYNKEAGKRGYEFNLSYEEFLKLFHQDCSYCGKNDARGIDRVNNSIGYEINNCVGCCAICNRMKRELTKEQFLNHIKLIYKNLNA